VVRALDRCAENAEYESTVSSPAIRFDVFELRPDSWSRWFLERMESAPSMLYVNPFSLALLKLDLGDRTGALAALERAYEERDGFLVHVGLDPRLDALHDEPRFRKLLRKLGLEAD
jgi:hypothetical protein